jgi:hypothetical protein
MSNPKQYSAADIQRYLKGEMSAEEMHAIETAALDDPFLADAIEGFETVIGKGNKEAVDVELGNLNKQFSERITQPAKVIPMSHSRWWQISAAAVVLVIIGFAVYNNRMKADEAQSKLAVTQKQHADSSALPEAETDRTSTSPALSNTQDKQEKKTAISPGATEKRPALIEEKTTNEAPNKSQQPENIPSIEKAGARNEDIASLRRYDQEKEKTRFEKPVIVNHAPAKREINVPSTDGADALARRNNQLAAQLNNFKGRVVDPSHKPLPNASLQILQNKTNVLTDESGNFNFTAKDSVVDVQVELVGFEQRNFRLQNNISSNNLVLEPGKQALEEVVVTGYGTERKKDVSKMSGKVQNAVPNIGWIEYEKYLETNKKPPAANPLMKGEVVVSFQVKRPAVLSDFKIEKSLSSEYDKEAIRMIREGPSWKLLNGRKTRITVIVRF